MAKKNVVGAKETIKAIKGLIKEYRKANAKVSREVMKRLVLPVALNKVSFLTGALHDSLVVRAAKFPRRSKNVGATVRTREGSFQGETFYGGFIEFGWRHWKDGSFVQGEAFLRPALYENRQQKIDLYQKLLKPLIDPIVRKLASEGDRLTRLLR